MKKWIMALGMMAVASQASALEFDTDQMYVGAGISSNSVATPGFDDAMGYQVFLGIPTDFTMGSVTTAVELGYMSSGEIDYTVADSNANIVDDTLDSVDGAWLNLVGTYAYDGDLNFIGRIGADFGSDTDALMYGIGLDMNMMDNIDVRVEAVRRGLDIDEPKNSDNLDSLQLNFVYNL